MTREILEGIRQDIIETLAVLYAQSVKLPLPARYLTVDLAKLNAFHELVCRELDRPECQHKADDLLCGLEVAYGHLLRFEASEIPDLDAVDACKITLESLLRKERGP